MPSKLRIAYVAHTLRSDWNNGNAHFLRGWMRALAAMGHDVTVVEPETEWSIENLRTEALGEHSLSQFAALYPELNVRTYARGAGEDWWRATLKDQDIVILHEWNPPEYAQRLLSFRDELGFLLLFHDTHHRASSTPEQMERFGLARFDCVLAFGEALRTIYRERFGLTRVWTLHEAADTTVFRPEPSAMKIRDAVWIGNWGEGERSHEIRDYYLKPAAALRDEARFAIYGVRYPPEGLDACSQAGVSYGGYLPNLDAPAVYAGARLTVHIPRQQYSTAMAGIPTIRVFEALACGIPLISAPWQDCEELFRPGDFTMVHSRAEMIAAMRRLWNDPAAAEGQRARGLKTILARHTCAHRAQQLTDICEELNG
ncbi:CgeB family protein [Granulicella sibirica]|uniref:Glycosyltransferase n=1 Tax=Granulicella sibirica TaxID=2479048 RepID=A0A4Q0SX42_9BACT|nr:glycosyltransferase [Granulicella sibirica]RXH54009.1 Glycosyltransferase [Granulicella sibirica]